MSHYFTKNANEISNRKEISFRFLHFIFQLITDNGTFSKDHVDSGTQILLTQVAKYDLSQRLICDLGCGYGVVGITLKSLFPDCQVFGFDPNDRAVALARENALKNKVEINFYVDEQLSRFCDVVVFNPPIRAGKVVIYQLFEQVSQQLNADGLMFVVMRKSHGVQSAIKYCQTLFKEVILLKKEKGYYVFLTKK